MFQLWVQVFVSACAVAVLLAVVSGDAQIQTLKSSAAGVLVDVVVSDSNGRPVSDLLREEFQLFENGVLQAIRSFHVGGDGRGLQAARMVASHPGADLLREEEDQPRVTALVFQGLGPEARGAAFEAARDIVDALEPGIDYATVFGVGRSTKRLSPLTRDKSVLHAAVRDAATRAEFTGETALVGDIPSAAESASTRPPAGLVDGGLTVEATIDGLFAITRFLASFPGKKVVVYLSEGFPVSLASNAVVRLEKLAALANEHRVVFYAIDAAGLRAQSPTASMRAELRAEGGATAVSLFGDQPYVSLTLLAERTGGQVTTDTNDIVGAARRALEDARATYTLGYIPTNGTIDGTYRRIEVRVSRPDVRVRARPGYWARRSEIPQYDAYEIPAIGALDVEPPPHAFPLEIGILGVARDGPQMRSVVVARTPMSSLGTRPETDGSWSYLALTMHARCTEVDKGTVAGGSRRRVLRVRLSNDDQANLPDVLFVRELDLAHGKYDVSVAAFDEVSGRGSVQRLRTSIEAPRRDGLLVGDLILIESARREPLTSEDEDGGNGVRLGDLLVVPNLTGRVQSNTSLRFAFSTALTSAIQEPVEASVALIGESSQPVARLVVRLDTPDRREGTVRFGRFDLGNVAPGQYRLVLLVDAGSVVERRERSVIIER